MGAELFIDGGYLNEPSIIAQSPIIAVMGLNSKLIMYDKVTLQNNYNNSTPLITSYYKQGSGVFVFSTNTEKPPEFIMRGGTIRGNTNNVNHSYPCGGGVLILDCGIFTMESGCIMDNNAALYGGGFFSLSSGTFVKTGGIIYGSDAATGFRNIVFEGTAWKKYGHSVYVSVVFPALFRYKNATVNENENLSFFGLLGDEKGSFGKGEKWETPEKDFRRILFRILLLSFIVLIFAIVIFWKRTKQNNPPEIDLSVFNLSAKEK